MCAENGAISINVQEPADEIWFEDSLDEEAYSTLTAEEGCDRDRDGGDGGVRRRVRSSSPPPQLEPAETTRLRRRKRSHRRS